MTDAELTDRFGAVWAEINRIACSASGMPPNPPREPARKCEHCQTTMGDWEPHHTPDGFPTRHETRQCECGMLFDERRKTRDGYVYPGDED